MAGVMTSAPIKEDREKPLTFWQIVASTLAAAFGVQSSSNRKRDFSRAKPIHFIVAGLVFTIAFITILVLVVRTVLENLV